MNKTLDFSFFWDNFYIPGMQLYHKKDLIWFYFFLPWTNIWKTIFIKAISETAFYQSVMPSENVIIFLEVLIINTIDQDFRKSDRMCSIKIHKISQNSQQNTCVAVSILIKLQTSDCKNIFFLDTYFVYLCNSNKS